MAGDEGKKQDDDQDDDDDDEPEPKPEAKPDERKAKPKPKSKPKPQSEERPARGRKDTDKEERPSGAIWLVAAAFGALLVWYFMRGNDEAKTSPPTRAPVTQPTPEPERPQKAPAPTPAPAPAIEVGPAPSAAASASARPTETPPSAGGGGAFDRGAAMKALAQMGTKASRCRTAEAPAGVLTAVVTFDPSGKATAAKVNAAPYAGTLTAKCVTTKLAETTVAAFSGDPQSVSVQVQLY